MKTITPGQIVATDSCGMPFAFKVIKTTAKTALCKELKLRITSDDGYGQNGTCVPVPDEFSSRAFYGEITLRIRNDSYNGDEYLYNRKERLCLFPYEEGHRLHYYTD